MSETAAPPTLAPVSVAGDACLLLTAPFFPARDPLAECQPLRPEPGSSLTPSGALVATEQTFGSLLGGTLTFEPFTLGDDVTAFEGSADLRAELGGLVVEVLECVDLQELVVDDVRGIVYTDGYGSIAVTICLADGWEPDFLDRTLVAVGRTGRELIAQVVRNRLLPELAELARGLGSTWEVSLPYFNLTYVGATEMAEPGRGALAVELRQLVYPNSPEPLRSASPWRDQFFYAGYAYNFLIMRDPHSQVAKLALLLLVLDVHYIRLARTSSAADESLSGSGATDTEWLRGLAQRLRSEYQALVTPTFSYDHHALRIRDAILRAWDVEKLHARTQDLLDIVRENVAIRLAEEQGRRLRRVNLVIALLTGLSFIATLDAAVSLYDRLMG